MTTLDYCDPDIPDGEPHCTDDGCLFPGYVEGELRDRECADLRMAKASNGAFVIVGVYCPCKCHEWPGQDWSDNGV